MPKLPITQHGNVDIRKGIPSGYRHINRQTIDGCRIKDICRKLRCRCVPALVGLPS